MELIIHRIGHRLESVREDGVVAGNEWRLPLIGKAELEKLPPEFVAARVEDVKGVLQAKHEPAVAGAVGPVGAEGFGQLLERDGLGIGDIVLLAQVDLCKRLERAVKPRNGIAEAALGGAAPGVMQQVFDPCRWRSDRACLPPDSRMSKRKS